MNAMDDDAAADGLGRAGTLSGARPTMQTVADHVGVSRQLVSLVLRDQPGASAATRDRVLAAAAELGYTPDASARALRGRRSHRLGVLFAMRQPFEVDLVEALFDAAAARGFSLVLGPLTDERTVADVVPELLAQRVEAILVLSADGGVERLGPIAAGVPITMVGGPTSTDARDDVRVDDAVGIRLLVEHLRGLGHEDIAHVTGGDGPAAERRRAAYAQAMADAGLGHRVDVVVGAYTEEAGARAAVELLDRAALPTAVIGANDRCAVGILGTLVRRGVRVPADVSVVGFDDTSMSSLPYVDLTTVGSAPRDLAVPAVETLVRRLEDPDAKDVAHRAVPRLVVRGSTGPAR